MSQTLNEAQVLHVARLSRLKLSAADVERYSRQLSSILDYVAQLRQLDVKGLEPMAHPLPLHSVMRDDEVAPALPVAQVLANAPACEEPFFTVPRVLDADLGGG